MYGAVTFFAPPPPPVAGKCRASDITKITTRGIYYYKEQGYDSQQVPVVPLAFSRAVMDENSLPPLFPVGGAWGGGCIG